MIDSQGLGAPTAHLDPGATRIAQSPPGALPSDNPASVFVGARDTPAIRILSRSLPKDWAIDGKLTDWEPVHSAGAGWLAVVMTKAGLVLAGHVPVGEFRLQLTLPSMDLPEVGTQMERGGVIGRYGCENKPWSTDPLSPNEADACRAAQRENLAYIEKYQQQFTKTYVVGEQCVRELGSSQIAPTIASEPGVCTLENNELTFETTLALSAFPAAGASPIGAFRVALSWHNAVEEPGFAASEPKLGTPVTLGTNAQLLGLIYEAAERADSHSGRPAIVYQPGANSRVRIYAFPGWRGPWDNMLISDVNPRTIVSREYNLDSPGKKLGRAEIRILPPELALAAILCDGEPKLLLPIHKTSRVFTRGGELQILSWVEGVQDSALRSEVKFNFERVRADGALVGSQSLSTVRAASTSAFHDAAYSRIGGYIPGAGRLYNGEPTRAEWIYSVKKKRYLQVDQEHPQGFDEEP